MMSDYNFKFFAFSVPPHSLDIIDCLLSLSESSNFLGVVASNYLTDPLEVSYLLTSPLSPD